MAPIGVAFEVEVTRSRNAARLFAFATAVPVVGLLMAARQVFAGPTLLIDGSSVLHVAAAAGCTATAAILSMKALGAWRSRRMPVSDRSGRPSCAATAATVQGNAAAPPPTLVVDPRGVPGLRAAPGEPVVPRALRSRCALPGLMLLVLAPSASTSPVGPIPLWARRRPTTLLLGRDTMTEDAWRRLNVWLRWMERGRHDLPVSRTE